MGLGVMRGAVRLARRQTRIGILRARTARRALHQRFAPPAPVRLDLGGVGQGTGGYLTVNLYPYAEPDFRADVMTLRGTGVRDGTVDEIFLSHTFEHIPLPQIDAALACWFRKLKSGGMLRIRGPDIEFYFALLQRGEISQEAFIHMMFSSYPRILAQPLMAHQWAWTRPFLRRTLEGSGFRRIEEYDAGDWRFDAEWFPQFHHVRVRNLGLLAYKP